MSQIETHKVLPEEEARAGKTGMNVRVVLVISTILAIVALGVILFAFVR